MCKLRPSYIGQCKSYEPVSMMLKVVYGEMKPVYVKSTLPLRSKRNTRVRSTRTCLPLLFPSKNDLSNLHGKLARII